MPTPPTPLVSFIVAADADADADSVARSVRSCLAQSLARIEVVCVRADRTGPVAPDISADPRLVAVAQPAGSTQAQLRRAGVEAANAPFVLLLHPGDTVPRSTAMRLHDRAVESTAQLVGFAVQVTTDRRAGEKLIAEPGPLRGSEILRSLVPRDTTAELDISRHLFQTDLLRRAYSASGVDSGPLFDDRAIVLLAYASATSYAAVSTVEYLRRPPHREVSADQGRLERALHRIAAFRAVEPIIREQARHSADPEPLLDGYTAGHLTAIGEALELLAALPPEMRAQGHDELRACVDDLDLISAAVTFAPDAIPALIAHRERLELGSAPVRSVLLTTNVLTTGGVSGVLLTQARFLIGSGYRVTIVTHRPGSAESLVPEGATLVQLTGTSRRQRVTQWAHLCRRFDVDLVIDHRILYSRDWPSFALAARAAGAATVGWIHNFAGRPTYNGNDLQTLLQTHLPALAHLVVLSPLDVAFWKLRGIRHVSYLPNPPSPFLLTTGGARDPKPAPLGRRLELVWWGRLEEHTKKVTQLVEVAAALERLGVDFRLRIVGPDWADMSADSLLALASTRGVADRVEATGPRHGSDLLDVIDSSDVFVNTSIIEGYPLTLPEAQSRGLPIAMYDLPWLSLIRDNSGVITTPQQKPEALAEALADLAADPERYETMSRASIAAAADATSFDFAQLYEQLLRGELPPEHSPEPTLEDGRRVLDLLVFFAERSTPPPRPASARSAAPRAAALGPRSQPRTFGERIERKLTPIGHRVIDAAPWLRPAANRVKRALLRR
ncbi:glycosyltransferase involved in cell wall biosynthesis [Microbacterium foliorum]|uniref:Glycosyltransferase involved in cell wall biosynthesis n=1 Tax=Microbacterium foliorum TaxID=104336 RepID=A0ABU1HRD3_9MICO|nr:glycosyltransferase involved in cell wall biosynthesis [Microbacterium foliorum]